MTDKTPEELAEEWVYADREGNGMQQHDYLDGAYYGFLAGHKACAEAPEAEVEISS